MGDRANIQMIQDGGKSSPLYFYTHWSGYELPTTLQNALKNGQDRWDDEQYLARIIFCELVGKDTGNTGFGITSYICDGGYKLLIVDAEKQTVSITDGWNSQKIVKSWSFAEYIAIKFGKHTWSVLTKMEDDDDE
jgi:hypothetical protein